MKNVLQKKNGLTRAYELTKYDISQFERLITIMYG